LSRLDEVILGFSHTQLVVRDVATSATWYCKTLGLEQFVEGAIDSGPYVGLRHPEARFVIGLQTATPEQSQTLASSAIEHLSFAVANRSMLEAMRAELLASDVAIGPIFEEAVSYNARLTDPDGLVLELTAPKPGAASATPPEAR
jgi:catechol 2,3-dioxygenase-like lactoylglutathione lyase family enzyme